MPVAGADDEEVDGVLGVEGWIGPFPDLFHTVTNRPAFVGVIRGA